MEWAEPWAGAAGPPPAHVPDKAQRVFPEGQGSRGEGSCRTGPAHRGPAHLASQDRSRLSSRHHHSGERQKIISYISLLSPVVGDMLFSLSHNHLIARKAALHGRPGWVGCHFSRSTWGHAPCHSSTGWSPRWSPLWSPCGSPLRTADRRHLGNRSLEHLKMETQNWMTSGSGSFVLGCSRIYSFIVGKEEIF